MNLKRGLILSLVALLSSTTVGECASGCPVLPSGYCFTDCSRVGSSTFSHMRVVCEGISSKTLHEDLIIFSGLETRFTLRIWNSPDITRLGGNIFAAVNDYIESFELENLPNLRMLPEVQDIRNLRFLTIRGTPMIEHLPLEALPSTLISVELLGTGITQFINDRPDFNGLPKLKSFTIRNQAVNFIYNFFSSFPALDTIEISDCMITITRGADPKTFITKKPLKLFRINGNTWKVFDVRYMSNILLQMLSGLKVDNGTEIDFYHNELPISKLGIQRFLSVAHVKKLILGGNTFDDYTTIEGTFQRFNDLEYLDLSYTQLPNSKEGVFAGLPKLNKLILDGNNLNTPVELFNGLTARNLSILHMASSSLRLLPAGISYFGKNLTVLKMSHNYLNTFNAFLAKSWAVLAQDKNSSLGLQKLQRLDISSNWITDFQSKSMQNLTSLTFLDISCNPFVTVTPKFFMYLPKSLVELNMTFCGDRESERPKIEKDAFEYLNNIKILHLGGGFFKAGILLRLHSMPMETLQGLQELYLPRNKIAYLNPDGSHFANMTGLRVLDLSFNRLQSISGNSFQPLVSLTHLNLANNAIFSIGEIDMKYLTNLRYLELSGNGMAQISDGAFDQLKDLTGLFLANNIFIDPMKVIKPSSHGGRNLVHLDLTNLPLSCIPPQLFMKYGSLKWIYFNESLPLFVDMDAVNSTLEQILETPMHPWAELKFNERKAIEGNAMEAERAFMRFEVPDPSNSIYQFILANFAGGYNPNERQIRRKIGNLICPN
ncbi:putative Leucine-rich repeats and immunoglobulin-like domains protein 2 [Hypsibius exemplaris]|uniref:Leucine-rich repeats and immunoglobulin-like domains protein 2 n=1 Tax=Hypsibius exemplaris TaxID=2072580 RepID=A0A9X6RKV5_HYPEX|nr:putative Leucine-rich repeats and immunoglobulin-like domains protein 2 [Hypsibius exemplaris]